MATANANQLTIQITAAMRLGAETRSLPLASYIAQLADSDAAAIRSSKIETPLNSAFRPNLSRESSDDDDEWLPRECPTDKREKILSMLAEGIPPIGVAPKVVNFNCHGLPNSRFRAKKASAISTATPTRSGVGDC
jgi:hypothetical protein